jgi:hypothetical protein
MTAVATGFVVPASIIAAGAVTAPPKAEVNPALGSFRATFTAGRPVLCTGEDAVPYETIAATVSGTSADPALAGTADFFLTGKLTEKATATINRKTGAGWGTGTITVTNGLKVISGPTVFVLAPISATASVTRGIWQPKVTVNGAVTNDGAIIQYESSPGTTANSLRGTWGGKATVGDLSVKNTLGHC